MLIRPYTPADLDATLGIFCSAVREVAARDYAPAQLRAWAPDDPDRAAWAARRADRPTWIAEIDGAPAGFTDLLPCGHIDMLFVHAAYQRRGAAATLLARAEQAAREAGVRRLTTDASLTARGFFLRQGFTVMSVQEVMIRGVALRNFRMEKPLG